MDPIPFYRLRSGALTDGAEVNQHGSSPIPSDTDSDGYSDFVEVSAGLIRQIQLFIQDGTCKLRTDQAD